jgi:putative Holliday junction resolvase
MSAGNRTLAVDWGKSRIGLAVTDESVGLVRTLPTLNRKNRATDLGELSRIIEENEVSKIVVGAPLHMHGAASSSSSQAEQLGRTLVKCCSVELVLWDERLTSVEAKDLLARRGGKRQRGDVDRVAAALILQSYLDNQAVGTGEESP